MDNSKSIIADAFNKLSDTISEEHAHEFASTKLEDVWKTVRDIDSSQRQRQSAQNLGRIKPLLEGIEKYAKVIEVLCNGTPYLPYVWAPIKLMVQFASQHYEVFESLLSAYADIGAVLPRFDRYEKAFSEIPSFRIALATMYKNILYFHRKAYKLLSRKAWHVLFLSLWRDYKKRFSGIIEGLKEQQVFLDAEAMSIHMSESKDARSQMQKDIQESQKKSLAILEQSETEARISRLQHSIAWLSVDDKTQEDNYEKISNQRHDETCLWIAKNDQFVSWRRDDGKNPVLWISGKPGAGKSVICSYILQLLGQPSGQNHTCYYFCNSQEAGNICSQILRTVALQLLRRNVDLASLIANQYVYQGTSCGMAQLRTLLPQMLETIDSTRIIIDGLDECSVETQMSVLKDLERLLGKDVHCKIIISSRRDVKIAEKLSGKTQIRLDELQEVESDIRLYVKYKVSSIKTTDPDLRTKIESILVEKANGMFLWVQLVVDELRGCGSDWELEDRAKSLPRGLKRAYGRIIDRITDESHSNYPRSLAIRILEWIACSYRPLKTFELLDGIVFKVGCTELNNRTKMRKSVLDSCRPLIEEGPSNTVDFVHFSAKEYVLDEEYKQATAFISRETANLNISFSCVAYLNTSLGLLPSKSTSQTRGVLVISGFHGLQLYANQFFTKHLQAYFTPLAASRGRPTPELVMELQKLLLFSKNLDDTVSATSSRVNWDMLSEYPQVVSFLQRLIAFREGLKQEEVSSNMLKSPEDVSLESCSSDPTYLSNARHSYQETVEALLSPRAADYFPDLDSGPLDNFVGIYGPAAYVCRYIHCSKATDGFDTFKQRDAHEAAHQRKFRCADSSCASFATGFTTRNALNRHNEKWHRVVTEFTKLLVLLPGNPSPRGQSQSGPSRRTRKPSPEKGHGFDRENNISKTLKPFPPSMAMEKHAMPLLQQQMIMNQNNMPGQAPRAMPPQPHQEGFSHLWRQMQASPLPGQQPPQAPIGLQNQGPPQNMAQNQQQFVPMPQQQNMGGRPGNGQQPMTQQDNAVVNELTNRLMSKAPEDEKNTLRTSLQQRMDPAQFSKYQSRGVDPIFMYYRNQAVNRLRKERSQRMQQQAQAQQAQAQQQQQLALSQQQSQNGPVAPQMQPQWSMNPSPMNGQAQPPTSVGGNPDFGSFMGNMENLAAQQQQQGVLAQEAGQMVVPVSVPPRNGTPQPGMAGQNIDMVPNPNPRTQQQQQMFNAQQIQQQRMQHAQQQQQQSQARLDAQQKAQSIGLRGQPGGMGPGPNPPQQSPAMATLNAPLRTPLQPISHPEPPQVNPNAQFGQPLDPRFMQGNRPGLANGMTFAGLNPAMLQNMSPEAQRALAAMPPEKINDMMPMPGPGQVRPSQQMLPGSFNLQNGGNQFMIGNPGQRPPQPMASMNPQQQMLLRTIQQMDNVDIPQIFQNHASMPQGSPPEIKKWGQLKQWIAQNPNLAGTNSLDAVKTLQRMHRQQGQVAGMQPGVQGPSGGPPNAPPAIVAPVAPMIPVNSVNMPDIGQIRQPIAQEIQTMRTHPSGKLAQASSDDVIEVPNPNIQQSRPSPQLAQDATQQLRQHPTSQQIAAMDPDIRKRYENAMRAAQNSNQAPKMSAEQTRLAVLFKEEQAKLPHTLPDIPMDEETRKKTAAALLNVLRAMINVSKALPRWFQVDHDEGQARRFFQARFRFGKQFLGDFNQPNATLRDTFSIDIAEIESTRSMMVAIVKVLSERYPNMKKHDGAAKNEQAHSSQTEPQIPAQPPTPLNAATLRQQQQQLNKLHQRNNSRSSNTPAAPTSSQPPFSFGATSPHGTPTYAGKNTLKQEDLHIPARKQKQNSTPVPGQVTPGSSSSPQVSKAVSPDMKRQHSDAKQRSNPECDRHNVGFESPEALKAQTQEEHIRQLENPLKYVQENLASTLGLDSQGNEATCHVSDT